MSICEVYHKNEVHHWVSIENNIGNNVKGERTEKSLARKLDTKVLTFKTIIIMTFFLLNNGKVIIIDAVLAMDIERDLRGHVGYLLDVFMFAETIAGRERNQKEHENLAKSVSFAQLEVKSKLNKYNVMELYKL